MDLFSLAANLTIDTSEYDRGLDNAEKKSSVFSDVLKANIVTKGIEVCVSGFKKLGDAATNAIKGAVDSFGQYEQLAGGVETLFKGASNAVMENASQAYKTAGLSANQYMETVTSFSAALLQSTGRGAQRDTEALKAQQAEQLKATKRSLDDQYDAVKRHWDDRIRTTKDSSKKASLQAQRDAELKSLKRSQEDQLEVIKANNKKAVEEVEKLNNTSKQTDASRKRAAELADMAVIDMADNANKMGTDMASIQTAYQGFSKQNYTMLDNLKLGYGGTKSEMERLLKDAEKLTGKKYDVSSYADIVEAIHAIQTEMGITGTTAKEGTETIEGSLNTLKGAWENMLLTIGSGEMNESMEGSVEALVTAVRNYLKNLLPVVKRSISGMVKFVGQLAPQVIKELPNVWGKVKSYLTRRLPRVMGRVLSDAFGGNFARDGFNIEKILKAAFGGAITVLEGIGSTLSDVWMNYIAPIGSNILELFAQKIIPTVGKLIDAFKPIWNAVAPKIKGAFDAIKGFWDRTLYPALYAIWDYVGKIIPDIKKWVEEDAVPAIENAFNAIEGFWTNTLKPVLDTLWDFTVNTLIPDIKSAWEDTLQPAIESVFTAIAGFWTDTLQPALTALYDYVYRDLIPTLIVAWEYDLQPAIERVFTAIVGFWTDTLKPAFEGIYSYVVETLIPTLIDWWKNHLAPVIETVFQGIVDFWNDPLKPVFEDMKKFITETLGPKFTELGDAVKGFIDNGLSPMTDALNNFMNGDGNAVVTWIKDSFITAWEGLKTEMSAILDFITSVFKGDWQSAWEALVNLVATPFNTLGEILKEPINAVIDLVNSMIGKVEAGVNKIINGLNAALTIHQDPVYDYFTGKVIPGSGYDISPNIQPISWGRIQRLATGGTLKPGQRAIVGEYAPEYIQMRGNQAVVTPMGSGAWRFQGGQSESRPTVLHVHFDMDRREFGHVVYELNREESQRVGMSFSNARL